MGRALVEQQLGGVPRLFEAALLCNTPTPQRIYLKMTELLDSVRTDFEAEQLNPKQLDRRLANAFVNV